MKVDPTHFHDMRNDEHYQFFGDFGMLVDRSNPAMLKIGAQFEVWKRCFDLENKAFKKITKSVFTEEISVADATRDRTFRGLVQANTALLSHFKPEWVAAAKQLQIVFNTYGNVARKALTEKTGLYDNLLSDLQGGTYSVHVETIGFDEWVNRLFEDNFAAAELIRRRFEETAGRSDVVLRDARKATDAAYAVIVERIEALMVVEGREDPGLMAVYELFVRRLNAIIEKYNNAIAARRGRGGSSEDKNPAGAAPEND